MKAVTRLKKLMWDNTILLTQNGKDMDMIITNKESGNSHIVTAPNWTELTKKAISDTAYYSKGNSFNF